MVLAFLAALAIPSTGTFHLPDGVVSISAELRLPAGAHDLTITGGDRTTLRAAPGFHGRAILSCEGCRRITLRDFAIDGHRDLLEKRMPVAPSDQPFARFYPNNGILILDAIGLTIDHVTVANVVNFAAIVNHCREVKLDHITVENSGSRNAKGRNNTSGGILLEEGTEDFSVTESAFRNIRGNALWTHSRYGSPRNRGGKFLKNHFSEIGRDAIQIGHATEVHVEDNQGARIGFPFEVVDVEGGGTPVAIDTAGNVDQSGYERNHFEEVNGKCIDLDGFHDGTIRGNTCANHQKPEDYPFGHFGIVFNNANPDMQSKNIIVEENELEGMKFGGIFVIGTGHRIVRNVLRHINTAHCNENQAQFGCSALGEPEVLQTGIYLGSHAERPAPASGNLIESNVISGWQMKARCIQAAPGVKLSDNTVRGNQCTDE